MSARSRVKRTIVPTKTQDAVELSLKDLEAVVRANIVAPSNSVRKKAEAELARMKRTQTCSYFKCLCVLMLESREAHVRSFSAVLLRQTLGITDDSFDHIPSAAQLAVQCSFVSAIQREADRNAIRQISHALGQCAVHVLCGKRKWDDLIPTLLKMAKSSDAKQRESFLIVLDRLAEFAIDILRPEFATVRSILSAALKDESGNVKKAALKACVSVLLSVDSKDELLYWSDLTPALFENICFEAGDDVISKTCEDLHDLVDNRPHFLSECMQPVIRCLTKVIQDERVCWESRRMAAGLLMTLLVHNISFVDSAEVATLVVPLVFCMCRAFDADCDWRSPDDDTEQVTVVYGGTVAVQLVELLSAEVFLATAFPLISAGLKSEDWLQNHASLFVIQEIMGGVAHLWSETMDSIMAATGKFVGAGCKPQLRYTALGVVKAMSVNFTEDGFQERFHRPVMSALLEIISNPKAQHRCVLIQAADTLAHFAFQCDKEVIDAYASKALECLYTNLALSGDFRLKDTVFKAVSVLINVLESDFAPFYSKFMALCQKILSETGGKLLLSGVRGRAIECIGQMCANVAYEQCRDDAHKALRCLIATQSQERDLGGMSYTFLMKMFTQMAEVMEDDFAPYLSHVISPLLLSMRLTPTRVVDTGVDDADKENLGISSIGSELGITVATHGIIGSKKITVNTSQLEEKTIAAECLLIYAECMGAHFVDFVKPTADLMLPLLRSRNESAVRRLAAECVAAMGAHFKDGLLLKKSLGTEEINSRLAAFFSEALPAMVECMDIEDDVEDVIALCASLSSMLNAAVGDCTTDPRAFVSEDVFLEMLQQLSTVISERIFRHLNAEDTSEQLDDAYSETVEAQLADAVTDLMATLTQLFAEAFVEPFDKNCLKSMSELLNEGSHRSDRALGISLFTEVIQNCGKKGTKYAPNLLRVCVESLKTGHSSPELLQSACFAVGVCATKDAISESWNQWVRALRAVVERTDAKSEDNNMATENAISAMGKILKHYGAEVEDLEQVASAWVSMLPIEADTDERVFCNSFFVDCLKRWADDWVKSGGSGFVQHCVRVVGVALTNEDSNAEQLKPVLSLFPVDAVNAAISALPTEIASAFSQ